MRITETSCCGAYEWACQGGQFLILRAKQPEGYQETGRGPYRQARSIWLTLLTEHAQEHREDRPRTAAKNRRRNRRPPEEPTALSEPRLS